MTGNGKPEGSDQHNPMRPQLGRLAGKVDLGTDIKLLQVEIVEPVEKAHFADYRPGQFAFVSALGIGEAPLVSPLPHQAVICWNLASRRWGL